MFLIKPGWVRVPAFAYAERLLESIENIPQSKENQRRKGRSGRRREGGQGRRAAREAKQSACWSRRVASVGEQRQRGFINANPTTYFPMSIFAVVSRVSVRIEFPAFERFDDHLFLNRNSCFRQAIGGSSRQPAGRNNCFHLSRRNCSAFVLVAYLAETSSFKPSSRSADLVSSTFCGSSASTKCHRWLIRD